MEKELKQIKKLYGEAMAKFCRNYFSTILEEEGKLLNLITTHFAPSHRLFDDLTKQSLEADFKNYIYSLIDLERNRFPSGKTPQELMDSVGYNLYECKTESDIQSFKKYYAKNEELCTFWGDRLEKCMVFFAVKKNVDEIKREDFLFPARQDEYGTSVISIQFTKDSSHTLSIKNRYNHRVVNPDATFGNNLDNIVPGLTYAFEEYYDIKQQNVCNNFEIPSYVVAKHSDGYYKYYKYNHEIDNVYFCPDNVIIEDFEVKRYEKEKYLIFDYFCLSLEDKKFIDIVRNLDLEFSKAIGKIKKIDIKKQDNNKILSIKPFYGEDIIIKLNEENCITEYKNLNLKHVKDDFLGFNIDIEKIEVSNIETIGKNFLANNEHLKEFVAPNLTSAGDCFLEDCISLSKFVAPKLTSLGSSILRFNTELETLDLPSLHSVGSRFLYNNKKLNKLNLPHLVSASGYFLHNNENLSEIILPFLTEIGDYSFGGKMPNLEKVILPSAFDVGDDFLANNVSLKEFYAPNTNADCIWRNGGLKIHPDGDELLKNRSKRKNYKEKNLNKKL